MMINNKLKQMIDNHTRAIIKLTDTIGQVIDYLQKKDENFKIEEGKLLDEKKND